jgi:uncharacterized membrane protein YhdT
MNYKFFLLILVDLAFLFYGVTTISISAKEAIIYYNHHDFLHYLVNFSTSLLGQNDFALRVPFILFHMGGVILLYDISGYYLKKEKDRLFTIALFMMLPGVLSSSLIANSSSITIFFTLLFIKLFYLDMKKLYYPLLFLMLFIDNSFEILYLGLFTYAIYKSDKKLAIVSAILFLVILYIYGFDSGGKPRGFFLDTLAMYALVFSPLLFLYYFYSMYRIVFKDEKTLLWFVSFMALLLSVVLSFRQRIPLSDFAPFAVIALPIVVQYFIKSYKVRLKAFRKPYQISLGLTILFLVINFLFTYFNKNLYYVLDDPKKHFAKKFHIAKELASKLKDKNIDAISCEDKDLCLRLKFYGLTMGDKFFVQSYKKLNNCKKVTISYSSIPIASYCVSNLHNYTAK